jgi:hypothetical protein
MYLIKNIANDRFKGALYRHDAHFGAQVGPLAVQLEPYIGQHLLKIGHQAVLTAEEYAACKDVIDTHVKGYVIEVTQLVSTPVSTTVELVPVVEVAVVEEAKVETVEVNIKVDPKVEVKPEPKVDPKTKKAGK